MKTKDAIDALIEYSAMANLAGYWQDERAIRKPARRAAAIKAALLSRIEQGDAAMEALQMVEIIIRDNDYVSCPWCNGDEARDPALFVHSDWCPRQKALGLQP